MLSHLHSRCTHCTILKCSDQSQLTLDARGHSLPSLQLHQTCPVTCLVTCPVTCPVTCLVTFPVTCPVTCCVTCPVTCFVTCPVTCPVICLVTCPVIFLNDFIPGSAGALAPRVILPRNFPKIVFAWALYVSASNCKEAVNIISCFKLYKVQLCFYW